MKRYVVQGQNKLTAWLPKNCFKKFKNIIFYEIEW